ncbi:response regulator transcription factor [Paenibacillus humicola]|uniref:response regulator transcription factor n=1 Tax=Paenibacillus humicola TaxID=3110540 RepID=UPI00237B9FBB|nr:response regulator transcription factor [Paenibacillus humicola]
MKIKVLICDDEVSYAEQLRAFLMREGDFDVPNVVTDKKSLLDFLQSNELDVLILDINLMTTANHQMEGLDISFEIKKMYPSVKIIMLSSIEEVDVMEQAFNVGKADNYITKYYFKDLPDAIRNVYQGKQFLHHSAAQQFLHKLSETREMEIKQKLNNHQLTILILYAEGLTKGEIASRLFLEPQTVSNYTYQISKELKGKFPYLEWLRLKKTNVDELVELMLD